MTHVIARIRHRLVQRHAVDAGLTLIEMMVTLLLMGIVGTIMFASVATRHAELMTTNTADIFDS